MAKEKNGGGGLSYILVIIIAIILFAYITICNMLNFDVIFKFGPLQYGYNLVHLHKDYSCTAEREIKVFQSMIPIDEMDRTGAYILKPGDRFGLKGYRSNGFVTWLAVEFYIKNAQVNAYAYIPDDIPIPTFASAMPFTDGEMKNQYFRELSAAELASVRDTYRSRFFHSASSRCQLQTARGPEEMQRIKESKVYKLIPADYMNTNNSTAYYCSKEQYGIVDKLYEMYIGDNFNTNLYQNSVYNPEVDCVFRDGFFFRVIDSIYFKLFALLSFIVFTFSFGSASREPES